MQYSLNIFWILFKRIFGIILALFAFTEMTSATTECPKGLKLSEAYFEANPVA